MGGDAGGCVSMRARLIVQNGVKNGKNGFDTAGDI